MDWRTKLLDPKPQARKNYTSLVTPVYRGSTVVLDDQAAVTDDWRQAENGYSYGLYGTPTTLELASRIAVFEGAHETFIVPGGQAAIALIYLSYCQAGSHALVPYSAYGPNKAMAEGLMRGLNVKVEPYDLMIGIGICDLIRANTALIWCESPGSVTMEIQDVPAIVNAAHAKGVAVALDNTYAAGIMFDAFAHGVDVSMQALTKYVGGHSDLLLGSVSARNDAAYGRLGPIYQQLGLAVSPDDCSLAIRGVCRRSQSGWRPWKKQRYKLHIGWLIIRWWMRSFILRCLHVPVTTCGCGISKGLPASFRLHLRTTSVQ